GYCYPAVDAAVAEQLARGMSYSLQSPLEVALADLLIEVIPCAEMVRFLKGGVDVNCAAARIARAYTRREGILNHGYRGWADEWNEHRNDGGMPVGVGAHVVGFRFNDLDHLEALFRAYDGKVAAVCFDPADPDKEATPVFLRGVRELAHRHGALLIYDEC